MSTTTRQEESMHCVFKSVCRAASVLALLVAMPTASWAGSIPMPGGSTSWISLNSGMRLDASGDQCAASITQVTGTYGPSGSISVNASLDAGGMHALITQTRSNFAFLFMSMLDTYSLHSDDLSVGAVVPVTVKLRAVGTLQPLPWDCCSVFGGGSMEIRISNTFDPSPLTSEFSRIGPAPVPSAQKNLSLSPPKPNAAIPIDVTASWTFNATMGTPFNLAYHLIADPASATFDFSHTATISFELPAGVTITSAKGYGQATPVQAETWGRLKNRYR